MRKLLCLLAIAVCSGNVLKAQDVVVKTNLGSILTGGASLHGEYVVTPASSVQLGGYYAALDIGSHFDAFLNDGVELKYQAFGVTPQYRWYPGGNEIPHGFFIAPLLSYSRITADYDNQPDNESGDFLLSLYGVGFDIGKQWIIKRRVSIGLSVGSVYNYSQFSSETSGFGEEDLETDFRGGIMPRFELSVGYAFSISPGRSVSKFE